MTHRTMILSTAPDPGKYERTLSPFILKNLKWPANQIKKAPKWVSVDLRDGNQAQEIPMNLEQKLEVFRLLVEMGYKEIEVGFPAASQMDFDFCRKLIDENLIPDDVTIQVLVQCREGLIKKTCEALTGAREVIIHFYNSTDVMQRDIVFNNSVDETIALAVEGAETVKRFSEELSKDGTKVRFEYSTESGSDTEMDVVLRTNNEVTKVIHPTSDNKLIINFPETVQRYTSDHFANQIEFLHQSLGSRENIELSAHPHNDCGSAISSAELAMKAGADRIEGCIDGGGERAGNVNLHILQANLYSRGIDPEIDLKKSKAARAVMNAISGMPTHPREPHSGDAVFTAYSGSHQDSINKGFDRMEQSGSNRWEQQHYLHIDPADLGREYTPIVVNGQSGKGGAMFVLKDQFGINLPKAAGIHFQKAVQAFADKNDSKVEPQKLHEIFKEEFMSGTPEVIESNTSSSGNKAHVQATLMINETQVNIDQEAEDGPIDAFVTGLKNQLGIKFTLEEYHQNVIDTEDKDSNAEGMSIVKIKLNGDEYWGAGIGKNTEENTFKAILQAVEKSKQTN